MLFTHQGLSGPVILQASSYWKPGEALQIDLLPDADAMELFRQEGSRIEMHNFLSEVFPKRFARLWCELSVRSNLCANIPAGTHGDGRSVA